MFEFCPTFDLSPPPPLKTNKQLTLTQQSFSPVPIEPLRWRRAGKKSRSKRLYLDETSRQSTAQNDVLRSRHSKAFQEPRPASLKKRELSWLRCGIYFDQAAGPLECCRLEARWLHVRQQEKKKIGLSLDLAHWVFLV